MILEEILPILEKYKNKDFLNRFRVRTEEDSPEQEIVFDSSLLLSILIEDFTSCSEIMHRSLFEGEFIICNIDNTFDSILDVVKVIPVLEYPDEEEQAILVELFDEGFKKLLSDFVTLYRQFQRHVIKRLDDQGYLIYNKDINDIFDKFNGNDFEIAMREQILLFAIHIDINEFDFSITETSNQKTNLQNLIRDYYRIKNISIRNRDLCRLLLDKCAFLINKLVIRLRKNKYQSMLIMENGNAAELILDKFKSVLFNEHKEYLFTHYKLNNNFGQNNELARFNKITYCNYDELKVKDLIQYVKFYHKYNPNLVEINKIREIFYKKFIQREQITLFDRNAYAKCLNYASNCALSLAISQPEDLKKHKIVTSLYEKVVESQRITKINNFYPHKEYLLYLISKIEILTEEHDKLDIPKIEDYLTRVESVLDKYFRSIEWSERNLSTLIQLPYEECIFTNKIGFTQNIFINGSYFIPLHETEIASDRDSILSNYQRANARYYIAKDRLKAKALIDDIGKADVRSMEILAMFSALVSFVIGSINTFGQVKSAYSAALLTLSLSTSLGLFVFLILGIHRGGIEKIRKHMWIIIVLISLIILLFLLLGFYEKESVVLNDLFLSVLKI